MKRNFHVPFWRAVEGATLSLTLIILKAALKQLSTVGQTETNASGESDLCQQKETDAGKSSRKSNKERKRKSNR